MSTGCRVQQGGNRDPVQRDEARNGVISGPVRWSCPDCGAGFLSRAPPEVVPANQDEAPRFFKSAKAGTFFESTRCLLDQCQTF